MGRTRFAYLVATIFLLTECSVRDTPVGIPNDRLAELDSFLLKILDTHPVPGLAVCVIKDDRVIYRAMGYRDMEKKLPLSDSTPFFVGPVSETFLASVVARLVASNRLTLDDKVSAHLPYFSLSGRPNQDVRIRHLLTHSSGIPVHNASWDGPDSIDLSLETTTRSISFQEPEFIPAGSKVKRSQYNFDILADVVEKVAGKRFETYMNEELAGSGVFSHSFYPRGNVPRAKVALPHTITDWLSYEVSLDTIYPHNPEHSGSTGLHASIRDLSGWMYGLLRAGRGEDVYPGVVAAKLVFGEEIPTSENSGIGLGWEIHRRDGIQRYSKSFYLQGFSGDLVMIPALRSAVLVLANTANEFDPTAMTEALMRWSEGGNLPDVEAPEHVVLGRLYRTTNQIDTALARFKGMLHRKGKCDDDMVASVSRLGYDLLYKERKSDDALRCFHFLVTEVPDRLSPRLALAEVYIVENDTASAGKHLNIARDLGAENDSSVKSQFDELVEALSVLKEEKPELPPEEYFFN